jgi:hypothetical protein
MNNEEIIEAASNEDVDFEDVMHGHFQSDKSLLYWCDIAREGRRVAGLLLEDSPEAEPIHTDSTLGGVFSAVAAQTEEGAITAFATALGVDEWALKMVMSGWIESNGTRRTDSIGFDGLKQEIELEGRKSP